MGRQAVHLAAQAGCEASVLYLLSDHKIDVNTRTSSSLVTPLHVASKVSVCWDFQGFLNLSLLL